MKEQSEAEKLFWSWFFLYHLTPSKLTMADCRRLAGAVLGREFPGMAGAPTIGQVRRQVKALGPELVEYARCPVRKSYWIDGKHEARIAELTAAAREHDAKVAAEREAANRQEEEQKNR